MMPTDEQILISRKQNVAVLYVWNFLLQSCKERSIEWCVLTHRCLNCGVLELGKVYSPLVHGELPQLERRRGLIFPRAKLGYIVRSSHMLAGLGSQVKNPDSQDPATLLSSSSVNIFRGKSQCVPSGSCSQVQYASHIKIQGTYFEWMHTGLGCWHITMLCTSTWQFPTPFPLQFAARKEGSLQLEKGEEKSGLAWGSTWGARFGKK